MMQMPNPRGKLSQDRDLAPLTWLRVGGPADWFFMPADVDDLAGFLKELDPGVSVFPMGVGSNLIVRRSEEHTSELQSPVPISYAVFCLKKKKKF